MKIKLDARTIAALQLPAGKNEEIFWDSELENFGLRLRRRTDGGLSRTFTAQYRADGHQRRKTWAADKLTPAQARDAARKHLAQVELGHDPQAEKVAKRRQATRTVRTVVATYLEARQSKLRPESFRIAKLYLENPMYFGKLHPKAIDAVVRADVAECVRTIASRRSAPTAAAARRALSAFFSWAIAEGLLGDGANPVVGTRRPDDSTPGDHVPTVAELVAIWKACGDDDFGRIVRLLILLGNRRQEVGGMCWSELELTAACGCCRRAQKSPIAYRGIAVAGAGDHPIDDENEPRPLVRRSRRCRIHRMGQRQGGDGSPAWQHGEAVAPARSTKGRRDRHDRSRHPIGSRRSSLEPLFRPPRGHPRRLQQERLHATDRDRTGAVGRACACHR